MLPIRLRNAIAQSIIMYETKRRVSLRGRAKKLSTAYVFDRIFYVCMSGCQMESIVC